MPIKGISDRVRMPRLGKIHLGVKAMNPKGVEYPKAVDYFVCPPEVQGVYGERPRLLDVVFPSDDLDIIAAQWYRAYTQTRGLVCKGDGETATRLIAQATRQVDGNGVIIGGDIPDSKVALVEWVEDIPCPGPACVYQEKKMCRAIMNLQFILPKVPGIGVYQLDTSSTNSITNINSFIHLLRSGLPSIVGLPLILELIPQEVSPEGKKKTVYVLSLKAEATWALLAKAKERPFYALPPTPDEMLPELLYPSPEAQEAAREGETEANIIPPTATIQPAAEEEPSLFDEENKKPPAPIRHFPDLNALFKAAWETWKMQPKAVLKELGYAAREDVTDSPDECWAKLLAIKSG